MRRKVLFRSKQMAAFALSLSMVLGEGAVVGAAEAMEVQSVAEKAGDMSEAALNDVEIRGQKIVAPTNLADVTGLTYDAAKRRLSWNKVPGATMYKVTAYKDGVKYDWNPTSQPYRDLEEDFYLPEGVYQIGVQAVNMNEWYVSANNVAWDSNWVSGVDYDSFDETCNPDGTYVYTLYKYPCSAEAKVDVAVSASASSTTATALTGIALKEVEKSVSDGVVVFTVSPAAELQNGEYIQYEFSNNAQFDDTKVGNWQYSGRSYSGDSREISFDLTRAEYPVMPGDVLYVRAKVYNYSGGYSEYVSTTYAVPKAEIASVDVNVTANSVRLMPELRAGSVTGYQYQRKNGKKWITLGKTSNDLTDKGLLKGQKYTYRVRGYSYNAATKGTAYTDWTKVEAYTWGSSLNLKAKAAGKKAVKLTWNKVAGADGYEIYRLENPSSAYTYKKGESIDSFNNYKLLKTLKGAKKKNYKDKKVSAGQRYSYIVRAYKNVGKNKSYIEDGATIVLSKEGAMFNGVTEYYNANGQLVVSWNKATGISGYKIEKKDAAGNWVSYGSLGKNKDSYTFPRVEPGYAAEQYRIAPYSDVNVYNSQTFTVSPKLPAVTGVKAVMSGEGVQVTWNPVSGADYYLVYRAKKDDVFYDKTTKMYRYDNNTIDAWEVPESWKSVYDTYVDTSKSTNLAPVGKVDVSTASGTVSVNKYDPNLKYDPEDGALCNDKTSYANVRITGTSAMDTSGVIQSLIRKEDVDPNYDYTKDPEWGVSGSLYEFVKNADGTLATQPMVYNPEGPEAGNEYFYFVTAVAGTANGRDGKNGTTYSAGYTKGAQVAYTGVTAASTKIKSVKSAGKGKVKITVKKAAGAAGYAVFRSNKKKGTYVQIGTTDKKSFTDVNAESGKTYYYKVASYKPSENGTFVYSALSTPKKIKAR